MADLDNINYEYEEYYSNWYYDDWPNRTTPEPPTDVISVIKRFFNNQDNLALYVVLPLFLLIYGGSCLLYSVSKLRRHYKGKELREALLARQKDEESSIGSFKRMDEDSDYGDSDTDDGSDGYSSGSVTDIGGMDSTRKRYQQGTITNKGKAKVQEETNSGTTNVKLVNESQQTGRGGVTGKVKVPLAVKENVPLTSKTPDYRTSSAKTTSSILFSLSNSPTPSKKFLGTPAFFPLSITPSGNKKSQAVNANSEVSKVSASSYHFLPIAPPLLRPLNFGGRLLSDSNNLMKCVTQRDVYTSLIHSSSHLHEAITTVQDVETKVKTGNPSAAEKLEFYIAEKRARKAVEIEECVHKKKWPQVPINFILKLKNEHNQRRRRSLAVRQWKVFSTD